MFDFECFNYGRIFLHEVSDASFCQKYLTKELQGILIPQLGSETSVPFYPFMIIVKTWKPPPQGLIKFNSDGCSFGESEGVILSNIEIICEERVNFFGKLDSKPIGVAWRVEGLDWSPIFRESVAWLDCPF